MSCLGEIIENGVKKRCWLPKDRVSPWNLCRRCAFNKMYHSLDTIQKKIKSETITEEDLEILLDTTFQRHMLHPAREQVMISTLKSLYNNELIGRPFVKNLIKLLQKHPEFQILINRNIAVHTPGERCALYTYLLSGSSCPTKCWSCISHCIKQEFTTKHSISKIFSDMRSLNIVTVFDYNEKVLIDILVTLDTMESFYFLSFFFHLEAIFTATSEEAANAFAMRVFSESALLHLYFNNNFQRKEKIANDLGKAIYEKIAARCDSFKEELMGAAWEPDRFQDWCIDFEAKRELDRLWH